jgi:hypothetical protein
MSDEPIKVNVPPPAPTPTGASETVVLDHPGTVGTRGITAHFHTNREVIVAAGAKEIVIGPTPTYKETHRYLRTPEKDAYGRTIFKLDDTFVAS